jgi:hypothetical protein
LEKPGLLGRLVLGKVRESSPIELVGPQSAKELAMIVSRLLWYGADVVLVDGALDRIAAASPSVTDGLVLATGASAHDNLRTVAQEAGNLAWVWQRPAPSDPGVRELANEAMRQGRVSFLDRRIPSGFRPRYTIRPTPYKSVLGHEEQVMALAGDAAFVVVPGAVTSKFLSLSASWPERGELQVIAKDAASVFGGGDANVTVYALNPANLVAITVNPVSYKGISYDSKQMVLSVHNAVRKSLGRTIPVFDVVSGLSNEKGVSGVALG